MWLTACCRKRQQTAEVVQLKKKAAAFQVANVSTSATTVPVPCLPQSNCNISLPEHSLYGNADTNNTTARTNGFSTDYPDYRGEARCCPDPCPSCQCTLSYVALRAVLRCLMLSGVLFVVSYAVLCCPVLSYDAVLCCPACTLVVCPSCPAPLCSLILSFFLQRSS